jgi:HK97 family phage prohead protease
VEQKKLNKTIEDKLREDRSYRNTQAFEVRSDVEAPDQKVVRGYATTFNEPYELGQWDDWDGYRVHFLEQIAPEAFDECDMSDVIMQYNHEGRVFARVSNQTLSLRTDAHGLLIEADLGGTEIGRDLYEEIKGGYTNRMSFGFSVSKDSRTEERDEDNKVRTITRTITGIRKLWDVSAVSIPANDGTEISARSWCEGVIAELTEEFRKAEATRQQKQRIKILTLTEV